MRSDAEREQRYGRCLRYERDWRGTVGDDGDDGGAIVRLPRRPGGVRAEDRAVFTIECGCEPLYDDFAERLSDHNL